MEIRPATPADARDLAFLVDQAGEGLPRYLWALSYGAKLQGDALLAYGAERALREKSNFSYRNMRVAVVGTAVAGVLLSYRLPAPYEPDERQGAPAVVQPLIDLEAEAPDSWYINAIATYERFRGQGIASGLLAEAHRLARQAGVDRLSLIVESENLTASLLYQKLGFRPVAQRSLVPYPGGRRQGYWMLMVKTLAQEEAVPVSRVC